MNRAINILVCIILLLYSCNDHNSANVEQSLNNNDTIFIATDSVSQVLLGECVKSFQNKYEKPVINIIIQKDSSSLAQLNNGNLQFIFLNRNLYSDEKNTSTQKLGFAPQQLTIGHDAITLLTDIKNTDSVITSSQLTDILLGKTKHKIIFDKDNNSILSYLINKLDINKSVKLAVYGVSGYEEAIQYSSKEPNAIIAINYSLLANPSDPNIKRLLQNKKFLAIKLNNQNMAVMPSQSTIADNSYPFSTSINLIEGKQLKYSGTTFVNYLYKTPIQRLILKFGIIPATMPGREINVKE